MPEVVCSCGIMLRHIFAKILMVLMLLVSSVYAQTNGTFDSKEVKPSIGLGVGFLNYYGEVNSLGNHSSLINQFGYEVHVARKINQFSDLGFSFLTGTMIGNERSLERNLNFRTDIYSVAVYGTFNLDYWLYWSDILNPYITIGFESFEYNNKADLVDANGALYHYWDDGTIRSIDQTSPLAREASLMQRDYVYETDLRSANLDGFGKYPQLAIAVPIGLGVNLNVNDRLSFKVSSTFHYTFTDLIDNVSRNGEGNRQGNGLNDFFTFNSVSLHYDLLSSPPNNNPENFSFPDYFVLDVNDEDGDGVVDGLDICPFTPKGVEVDSDGCPLDDDNDGVPNYLDIELETNETAFVDADGMTLTDADFYQQYLRYIDSADVPIEVLYKIAGEPVMAGQFRILLGEFKESIPEYLAEKFVKEGDVIAIMNKSNQTAYLTKKYASYQEALKRKQELLAKGMPQATIVVWDGKNYFSKEEWAYKSEKELKDRYEDYYENKESLEGNYAVKLGDTDADALTADKAKFFEYKDVAVLKGDSGKADYVIGPFIDKVGAAQLLEEVDRKKYPNAEVVRVKRGKASSVGVQIKDVEQSPVAGPENWNKKREDKSPKKKFGLDKLNGSIVLDFGKKGDPKTEAAVNKARTTTEIAEVKDNNGDTHYITKKPQSDSYVREQVAKFQEQGVTPEIKQVKDGDLIPVDPKSLAQAEELAVAKNPTKKKKDGLLSKLEGGFAIDFGKADDKKVQEAIKEIEKIVEVEKASPNNGEDRLVTSEIQTPEEAEKIIKTLKKAGVEADLVEVKNGELIPANNKLPSSNSKDNLLDKLNGGFAIDFGSPKDPATKKAIDKIKASTQVEEVKTQSGETKLISKEPISQEKAEQIISSLAKDEIKSELVKVKDGELVPVDPASLGGESGKKDGLLTKLNDAFVIDFGKADDGKAKAALNEIKKSITTKEVVTVNGEKKLISDQPQSKAEAKAIVKQLEEKGIEAKIAKVKDGELVSIDPKSLYSEEDKADVAKAEGRKGIDFGVAQTAASQDAYEELKKTPGIVEVKDEEGNKQLLATSEKAEKAIEQKAEELSDKGININTTKVEDGDVVRTKFEKAPKGKSEDLKDVEGAFGINFGKINSPGKKKALEKLKASGNYEEIKDEDGNTILVAKSKDAEKVGKEVLAQLEISGEDVTESKVEGGKVVNKEEDLVTGNTPDVETEIEIDSDFDTPALSSSELDKLENSYVVKLGTVDASTPMIDRGKLLNAPNTLKVKNNDGSIDVISTTPNKTEEGAYAEKAGFNARGFTEAKVAYFKDGKPEVIRKEELEGKYTVSMGSFKSNVSSEEVNKILSIPEIESIETHNPEMTTYVLGTYDTPEEAKKNMEDLIKKGLNPSLVKVEKGKISAVDLGSVFDQATIDRLKLLSDQAELVKTDEIVFRVQLGAFRGKIDRNVFRGVNTLSFPTAGGVTKYVTGSFNTYQQAYVHKLDMRKMGFSGAFVVAYKDGKRIKVTDLVNQEKFQQVKQTVSPIEKELKKVEEVKTTKTSAEANKPKVSYKVQVGAYKDDEEPTELSNFPDVEMEVYGQYKRYLSGEFSSYSDANQHKKSVKEKGFEGAFIVAYNNGRRVAAPGEQTNVITKNDLSSSKETPSIDPNGYKLSKVLIMAQVGLYRGDIPSDLKEQFSKLPNITKQVTAHGVIRYMTGNFKNLSEATAFKEELTKNGFPDAFLVAYYDSERVKIQEIVEILKTAK